MKCHECHRELRRMIELDGRFWLQLSMEDAEELTCSLLCPDCIPAEMAEPYQAFMKKRHTPKERVMCRTCFGRGTVSREVQP